MVTLLDESALQIDLWVTKVDIGTNKIHVTRGLQVDPKAYKARPNGLRKNSNEPLQVSFGHLIRPHEPRNHQN